MLSGTSLKQTNNLKGGRPQSGAAGFKGKVHHGHVLSSKTLATGGLNYASGNIPMS